MGSLPCSKASVLFLFVAMAGFDCSFRASAGQFGLGSWHPGVGPGRLLKYLVFNAFSKKRNQKNEVLFFVFILDKAQLCSPGWCVI